MGLSSLILTPFCSTVYVSDSLSIRLSGVAVGRKKLELLLSPPP